MSSATARKRTKLDDVRPELPKPPQVGDRIRIKPERIGKLMEACKQAGWDDVDPYAIRVITRTDPYLPGGGRRLFVDGPPFAFNPVDVMLAWNTEDERREELKRRGWAV